MAMITQPGIYADCTAEQYHADCAPEPSLSSSIAKLIVSKSPRHAWTAHPRLRLSSVVGNEEDEAPDPKAKKEQEKGTLVHRLVLGKGGDIVVCPFDNWRKDAAKEMRASAKSEGHIATLPHLKSDADHTAKAIRQQLDDMGLQRVFRAGQMEVVIVWQDNGISMRAMIDNLIINEDNHTAEVWDLKTTARSAHPESCASLIDKLGYDLSLEFYTRGLIALRPDLAGRIQRRWVFAEVEPPYAATPVEISSEWQMAAEMKCSRAIARWRKCMAENKWPFYVEGVARLEPKPWMLGELMVGGDNE